MNYFRWTIGCAQLQIRQRHHRGFGRVDSSHTDIWNSHPDGKPQAEPGKAYGKDSRSASSVPILAV